RGPARRQVVLQTGRHRGRTGARTGSRRDAGRNRAPRRVRRHRRTVLSTCHTRRSRRICARRERPLHAVSHARRTPVMIRHLLSNPAQRRQTITLTSGALIVAALIAGHALALDTLRDALMILAALIAGWDIAGRAFYALRNRHVSIELLVTIATAGALAIGEYWEAAAVTFLFMLGAYL